MCLISRTPPRKKSSKKNSSKPGTSTSTPDSAPQPATRIIKNTTTSHSQTLELPTSRLPHCMTQKAACQAPTIQITPATPKPPSSCACVEQACITASVCRCTAAPSTATSNDVPAENSHPSIYRASALSDIDFVQTLTQKLNPPAPAPAPKGPSEVEKKMQDEIKKIGDAVRAKDREEEIATAVANARADMAKKENEREKERGEREKEKQKEEEKEKERQREKQKEEKKEKEKQKQKEKDAEAQKAQQQQQQQHCCSVNSASCTFCPQNAAPKTAPGQDGVVFHIHTHPDGTVHGDGGGNTRGLENADASAGTLYERRGSGANDATMMMARRMLDRVRGIEERTAMLEVEVEMGLERDRERDMERQRRRHWRHWDREEERHRYPGGARGMGYF